MFRLRVDSRSFDENFVLAISICKKLFPDYKDFFQENQWGDPDILLDSISLCESYYKNQNGIQSLREMLPKIDKITPDSEDFGNSSYALNASASVYETIEFLTDKDNKHILNIGSYLTDSIDFKIQEEDELSEEEIDEHQLMIEARNFLLA